MASGGGKFLQGNQAGADHFALVHRDGGQQSLRDDGLDGLRCIPVSITTDKLGSYPKALRRLKRKGELKDTVQHRTSKYLNNRIEADHGALKRLIRPTRGFQSMKTAYATIKGFEIKRMIRRRHCILIEPGVTGEVRFVNKLFDLAA